MVHYLCKHDALGCATPWHWLRMPGNTFWSVCSSQLSRRAQCAHHVRTHFACAAVNWRLCWAQTEGYLPAASVAFIDEVFKANSAILNTLLTILNERLFDNGADRVRVPLVCLARASS